jgi:hypothetical protein
MHDQEGQISVASQQGRSREKSGNPLPDPVEVDFPKRISLGKMP